MRREWIEISCQEIQKGLIRSPSMRREWIEIIYILRREKS